MQDLVIDNFSENDISDFIGYLLTELRWYIIDETDINQLRRIDEYLNSSQFPQYEVNGKDAKWSSAGIIDGALKNLTYSNKDDKEYRIFINPNAYIGSTGISYEQMMNLIDKGNLMLSSYPIWTKAVEHFDENAPDMYDEYYEEA